jgi:ATP-binding cassette, subfamily B, bacterial MsbA
MRTYRRLLSYLKPYKARLFLAVICTLGYTLAHSLVSVTVFIVLNGIQNQDRVVIDDMPRVSWLEKFNLPTLDLPAIEFSTTFVPVIVVAVFVLRGIFEYASRYQMAVVGLRVIRHIRDRLYEHLTRLSMNFYAKGRTGDLMSRTIQDVSVVQAGLSDVLVDLAKQPLVILFQIPLVLYWGGPIALIALVVFPVVLIPIIYLGQRLRTIQRKVQEQISNINSQMQETFSGMNVVKAFNMEQYETRKFETINRNVFGFLRRAVVITTGQRPLIEIMGAVAIAFAIWYGIRVLPLDRFASFLTCLFLFYEPLKKLSKVNATIQQSVAAGDRIFELLNEKPQIQNRTNAVDLARPINSVEFSNVSLAYEQGDEVLREIQLSVRANEVIAIVGTSGAGKTSLVNLLPRFYDPSKGAVKINGKDIRQYHTKSLREHIGIVTQETFLFNVTVLENIAYGRLDASLEEVKEAARAAFAEDFIKALPKGFGTVVGERGVMLSGGQRQRLSIARALLKNPPILILDEATSQLDTESEREVQRALERLMKDRTVFVIAHRLSTIQNADRIIVLDRGRLVQSGTNQTLLREGGVYKRLHDLQFNL